MIPSYFKIEILAVRDEFVTLGHKGLIVRLHIFYLYSSSKINMRLPNRNSTIFLYSNSV